MTLEELNALVALVEVRQEVSDDELRAHLLRLFRWFEDVRAKPESDLESRLVEVMTDLQSLRRESSERLAHLQAQLDALARR